MNNTIELQGLDFACKVTKNKNAGFSNIGYIQDAIVHLINGQANGFTRDQGARDYVKNLSKEEIDKELFLNIVKLAALKNYKHEATLLSTNKNFGDQLSNDEFELLTLQAIKSNDMNQVKAFFDTHPNLYKMLIVSFVYRRYFDPLHTTEELDNNDMMTTSWEYASLQGKVEDGFNKPRTY